MGAAVHKLNRVNIQLLVAVAMQMLFLALSALYVHSGFFPSIPVRAGAFGIMFIVQTENLLAPETCRGSVESTLI